MGCRLMKLFFCQDIFLALQGKEEEGCAKGGKNSEGIHGLAQDQRKAGKLRGIYFCK